MDSWLATILDLHPKEVSDSVWRLAPEQPSLQDSCPPHIPISNGQITLPHAPMTFNLQREIYHFQTSTESSMHQPLARILTAISLIIHGVGALKDNVIGFISVPDTVLPATEDITQRPNLCAIFMTLAQAHAIIARQAPYSAPCTVSAHRILAFVEAKLSYLSLAQTFRHIKFLLHHLPHYIVVHGLSVSKESLRIRSLTLDAQCNGPPVLWTDTHASLDCLAQFIHLLYNPQTENSLHLQEVAWAAKCPYAIFSHSAADGSEHHLWPLQRGRAMSRNPVIFYGVKAKSNIDECEGGIWKFSWQDSQKRDSEVQLLGSIHKDGFVPGIVRLFPEYVPDSATLQQWAGPEINRVRTIIPMATKGLPLAYCDSVREVVECLYDAVAILWSLEANHEIAYRDFSFGNILIRPVHFQGPPDEFPLRGDRTIQYVSELLNEKTFKIRVVLGDFDSAIRNTSPDLYIATGTPIFAARDVLQPRCYADEMPRRMKTRLLSLANAIPDPSFKTSLQSFFDTPSSALDTFDIPSPPSFQHLPIHDVESVFKVFGFYLLRAHVVGIDPEKHLYQRSKRVAAMMDQEFGTGDSNVIWTDVPIDGSAKFAPYMEALDAFFLSTGLEFPAFQRSGNLCYAGHILLQCAFATFLKEILKDSPMPVQPIPLKVRTKAGRYKELETGQWTIGQLHSTQIKQLVTGIQEKESPMTMKEKLCSAPLPGTIFPEDCFELFYAIQLQRLWYSADPMPCMAEYD